MCDVLFFVDSFSFVFLISVAGHLPGRTSAVATRSAISQTHFAANRPSWSHHVGTDTLIDPWAA